MLFSADQHAIWHKVLDGVRDDGYQTPTTTHYTNHVTEVRTCDKHNARTMTRNTNKTRINNNTDKQYDTDKYSKQQTNERTEHITMTQQ